MELYERLMSKVKVNESMSWNGMNCMEWQASLTFDGYGQIRVGSNKDRSSKVARAHRVAWKLFRGEIPAGLHVLHRCDNRKCCNPAHLFIGTNYDNMQDRNAKGRSRAPLGEASSKAKLRDADIPVIRNRLAAGETQTAIARDYGVFKTAISKVAAGKTWSHVACCEGETP